MGSILHLWTPDTATRRRTIGMMIQEALTVPWAGCVLHRIHLPRPVRTHKHHVFPKYLQIRKYGQIRDKELVYVCATGHDDVHAAIEALLLSRPIPRGVGQKEWQMATEAVQRYAG
jgi:hypothetical protein